MRSRASIRTTAPAAATCPWPPGSPASSSPGAARRRRSSSARSCRPVVVGADVIDRRVDERLVLEPPARLFVHDVTQVPWPFADGEYDLFVALQVFEHLGTSQVAAFHEVGRVARRAIISLPIDWQMDDPAQLPPHDLERTGAVVVPAVAPDPDRGRQSRLADPPRLRLRGPLGGLRARLTRSPADTVSFAGATG